MDFISSSLKFIFKIYKKEKNEDTNNEEVSIFTTDALEYSECNAFIPLPEGSVVYVCKVYDGDSLTISFTHPITDEPVRIGCRINGIDTPEIRGSSTKEKELAYLAKERLSRVTSGKFVTIINPGIEKYGRVLCDLKTNEIESIKDHMLSDPNICKPYSGGTKESWD